MIWIWRRSYPSLSYASDTAVSTEQPTQWLYLVILQTLVSALRYRCSDFFLTNTDSDAWASGIGWYFPLAYFKDVLFCSTLENWKINLLLLSGGQTKLHCNFDLFFTYLTVCTPVLINPYWANVSSLATCCYQDFVILKRGNIDLQCCSGCSLYHFFSLLHLYLLSFLYFSAIVLNGSDSASH